jgi:hypothetical protein
MLGRVRDGGAGPMSGKHNGSGGLNGAIRGRSGGPISTKRPRSDEDGESDGETSAPEHDN